MVVNTSACSYSGMIEEFSSNNIGINLPHNGDGYMDVLGAAISANDITWWDLTAFISNGSLESSVLDVRENPA